jgi:uncharacterized membrane protein YcjF (UPF0283 family)
VFLGYSPKEIVMKRINWTIMLSLFALATVTTGCEVIGDIFGAGVYTGVFLVIFVIVIIIVIIARVFRR